ncbi:hypothetical protein F2Q69_00047491 [Brassica cretica]|uniref:Uncharacterized protein n=1 Tax=Brassica cretica TaxID=69181 RepID=A0A8S9PHQ4_BRACR|nr:hypothetical protein F2Q69_00047491 [Brassica cretica]
MRYADGSPCHAGLHSRPELELYSQPYLAAEYRSMSDAECRSMTGGKCRSTKEKSRSTVEGECRSKNECCCRSMWCVFLCGLSVINVQDLKRAMFVPCCFWYCKTCS